MPALSAQPSALCTRDSRLSAAKPQAATTNHQPQFTNSPLRILLVTHFFPPHNAAASLRTYGFARHWAAAGEDVTVLTTVKPPDHRGLEMPIDGFNVHEVDFRVPRFLARLRGSYNLTAVESVDGAAASLSTRSRSWLGRNLIRLRERSGAFGSVRMPDLTDWWVRPAVAWAMAQPRWDVVVSSSGPYTTHLIARALKQRGQATRWVADYRDRWTGNEFYRGLFPFTVVERARERDCWRQMDLIFTVSPALAGEFARRSGRPAEVIYNSFDESGPGGGRAGSIQSASQSRLADNITRIVYTGSLYLTETSRTGLGQSPEPLLAAMAQLQAQRPDLARRLRLVVAGAQREQWLELAQRQGVAAMLEHRGMVDRDDALRLQRQADALLILDWRNPRAGVLTTKLFEYLHAEAPILAIGPGSGSPIAEMLQLTRRGMHLGERVEDVRAVLTKLIESPQELRQQADLEIVKQFSRQRQALRALDCLRHVIQQPSRVSPGFPDDRLNV